MTFNIIKTGSKGNAVILGGIILIDCGVPYKDLANAIEDVNIVLLTHIHGDHFKKSTIRRLARDRPTLRFACCEWLVKPLLEAEVMAENIDVLEIGKKYDYGLFQISPVLLYHNVPNCGYRVFFNSEKVFYATDTTTLKGIEARDYDLYLVEANYDEDEIAERIAKKEADGIYPYEYEVLKNHLSKKDCNDFVYSNMGPHSKFVYLHEHKE